MDHAVPQRSSKVMKSLALLQGQSEFQLAELDESLALKNPWIIGFEPPENSPYHPQPMKLKISFPARYPFDPPLATFLTPIYHPNIDTNGNICLDLLKPLPSGSWRPSIDILTLLTAIKLLLAEPNPDDPLMPDIAALYRDDHEAYLKNALAVSLGEPIRARNDSDKIETKVEGSRTLLRAKLGKPKETKKIEASSSPESPTIIDPVISPVAINHNDEDEDDEFEVKPKAKRPTLS